MIQSEAKNSKWEERAAFSLMNNPINSNQVCKDHMNRILDNTNRNSFSEIKTKRLPDSKYATVRTQEQQGKDSLEKNYVAKSIHNLLSLKIFFVAQLLTLV